MRATTILILTVLSITFGSTYAQTEISYRKSPDRDTVGPDSLFSHNDGFIQKINNDEDNNRLEITNKNKTFRMSIGGRVKVTAMIDFGGTIDDESFVTSLIPVPTFRENQFRMFLSQSRLNFKVEGIVKKRPLLAYIEGDFNGSGAAFRLRHAYISYAGFTAGQTWSTFMDLDASPATIDGEGPNNEIAVRQPMIRYTYQKNRFEFAVAAEMPMDAIQNTRIETQSANPLRIYAQHKYCPDFPIHFKYEAAFGHIQVAGIFRLLNYMDSMQVKPRTVYVPAGGVSLSGTFNIRKKTKIIYQVAGGCGIANYIQDISSFRYDLIPSTVIGETLKPSIMYGGYVAVSHDWSKTIQTNVIYGINRLESPFEWNQTAETYFALLYRRAQYVAVNVFWDFIPFGQIGLEYLWGQRTNYNGQSGNANRINLMVKYCF